ncbi:MAG: rod shape-determining protein MreD [Chromatiales bacterium]|jgi:rod shape-determining protein MreD|nr:rod shape-determining protein MreD [Chromatiales bacterium]
MVIILSFIAALALAVIPLPDVLAALRPEWVALVLIYWCMALPERVGVGVGWITGLLLDVLRGGLLGQHGLSFAIVAYITLQFYQRLRVYPLWQQSVSVFVLVLLHLLLQLWIKGISGNPTDALATLLPAFSSMLAWPLVFLLLRNLRRRFVVS